MEAVVIQHRGRDEATDVFDAGEALLPVGPGPAWRNMPRPCFEARPTDKLATAAHMSRPCVMSGARTAACSESANVLFPIANATVTLEDGSTPLANAMAG